MQDVLMVISPRLWIQHLPADLGFSFLLCSQEALAQGQLLYRSTHVVPLKLTTIFFPGPKIVPLRLPLMPRLLLSQVPGFIPLVQINLAH